MKTCKKLITTMIAASLLLSGSVFAKEASASAKQGVTSLSFLAAKDAKNIIASDPMYIFLLKTETISPEIEQALFHTLVLKKLDQINKELGVKCV